jgi:S-DNA-T family DNA segregation ATPase FtsK/SpoIIIE
MATTLRRPAGFRNTRPARPVEPPIALDDTPPRLWRRVLVRLATLLLGTASLAASVFLAVALLGFSPGDPSLNNATAQAITNPAGRAGAYAADLALQLFGAASWLIVAVLAAWGIRWLAGARWGRAWVLASSLPLALLSLSLYLSTIPVGEAEPWPYRVGYGGIVGDFQLNRLAARLPIAWITWTSLGIALILSVRALGVRLRESRDALAGAGRLSLRVGRGLGEIARRPASGNLAPALVPPDDPGPEAGDTQGFLANLGGRLRRRRAVAEPAPAAPSVPAATPQRRARRPRVPITEPALATGTEAEAEAIAEIVVPPHQPAGGFVLPPLELLTPVRNQRHASLDPQALAETSRQLETVLQDFGVRGEITGAKPGPVVTLHELEPAPGTRAARVISLADDIARSLSAHSVRVATVPGRNVIGIELPNPERETVYLREMLQSELFRNSNLRLALALGKDISGRPMVVDLARMPHLLIAGTTGSGKSVAINAMILSLLYRLTPEQCRIIMIDPKVIELSVYEDIPHLLAPVVTEPHKAVTALKWVVRQMDERYRLMSHLGVREIFAYNRRIEQARAEGEWLKRRVRTGWDPLTGQPVFEEQPIDMTPFPLIVVIVDEVADLMLTAGKEIENAIQRLSQKARAAGIHLIVATQRPSVDVLTGVIKANLPSRISFRVSSKIDSRTILGEPGAEQLLGHGDMLFMMPSERITRIHGPLVTDGEVEAVVRHLKHQGRPDYVEDVTADAAEDEAGGSGGQRELELPGGTGQDDSLYQKAVHVVARDGKASTSYLQRKLNVGYNTAAKLIERMEAEGLISTADHVGRRRVLMGKGGVDGDTPTHV